MISNFIKRVYKKVKVLETIIIEKTQIEISIIYFGSKPLLEIVKGSCNEE